MCFVCGLKLVLRLQEQWCKKAPPTHEMIVRYQMQPPFPSDPPSVHPANQEQVGSELVWLWQCLLVVKGFQTHVTWLFLFSLVFEVID